MSEHEITSRIRRDELLGLLHTTRTVERERITARMPAITLESLLIPEELPAPPFVIRFRSPAGTDQIEPIDDANALPDVAVEVQLDTIPASDGTIDDDIEPEVSVAISRVTSQALDATITAAIDAAVDEAIATSTLPSDLPERRRNTAIIARYIQDERIRVVPMVCGFLLTFMAGIGLMMCIG